MPRRETRVAPDAALGFDSELSAPTEALRNPTDVAGDTPVVVGLAFPGHVGDTREGLSRRTDGRASQGDSPQSDSLPDAEADGVLANPPFNVSHWRGELLRQDKRWQYDVPPADDAKLPWAQLIVVDLAPTGPAGRGLGTHGISAR